MTISFTCRGHLQTPEGQKYVSEKHWSKIRDFCILQKYSTSNTRKPGDPARVIKYFHKPAENRRVTWCDLLPMESSLCYYLLSKSLDFQGSAVAFNYILICMTK